MCLEGCDIARSGDENIFACNGVHIDVTGCRIHDAKATGVHIFQINTVCRLEGSEIWGNRCGVCVRDGAETVLVGNAIRDHARGNEDDQFSGAGLFVASDAAGCATVSPDNVFARNAGGDVVREEAGEGGEEEE